MLIIAPFMLLYLPSPVYKRNVKTSKTVILSVILLGIWESCAMENIWTFKSAVVTVLWRNCALKICILKVVFVHLRNVGISPHHYTVSQPRIPRHESSSPWRPEIWQELRNVYASPNVTWFIISRRTRLAGHVAHLGETRNAYKILVGKS